MKVNKKEKGQSLIIFGYGFKGQFKLKGACPLGLSPEKSKKLKNRDSPKS